MRFLCVRMKSIATQFFSPLDSMRNERILLENFLTCEIQLSFGHLLSSLPSIQLKTSNPSCFLDDCESLMGHHCFVSFWSL